MVQFAVGKPKSAKPPPPQGFPYDLTLAVRFYRAMFINPELNVLATLDLQLVRSLYEQADFWHVVDRAYRRNPRREIQSIVKNELKAIFEAREQEQNQA